jgi:parallel beta-helix repeat protein
MLLSTTIYVDANASSPTHDGISWPTAFTDLQQALAIVTAGDEIHVADGVYKPTAGIDRSVSFKLKTGVRLAGGYAGAGAADPDARDVRLYETILSGDIGAANDNADNSQHVLTAYSVKATAILDGFTVTAGNADGTSGTSSYFGGGMDCGGSGSPTVIGCTFIRNAAHFGGAIDNAGSDATFTNCRFVGNCAIGRGGAIEASSPKLTNCAFSGNIAEAGGALSLQGSSGTKIVNCTFAGNSSEYGGAIYSFFYLQSLSNCILWHNEAAHGPSVYGLELGIAYCDVEGGWTGTGNIDADPVFFRDPSPGTDAKWGTPDDDFGDLRLQSVSYAVDAGDNSRVTAGTTTDISGTNRFQDIAATPDTGAGTAPIVDMGSYEATLDFSMTAGGPYAAIADSQYQLKARAVSDVVGGIVYEWDFDQDGQFDDATGPTPLFSTVGLAPWTMHDISLRVTDASNRSLISSTTLSVRPANLYVDARSSGGDGTSWNQAYNDLASAMRLGIPGMTIKVAGGTYTPSSNPDPELSFELRNGVAVLGSYAGLGAADPEERDTASHPTILSGEIGAAGSTSDNVQYVLRASRIGPTSILDGVTITGAYRSGMSFDAANPQINNCIFYANGGYGPGGGAMYISTSSPTLIGCRFLANVGPTSGIYNSSSSPNLINCIFVGNGGYAMSSIGSTSAPVLTNCTFSRNSGRGVMTNSATSKTTLTNCVVWGNTVAVGGIVIDKTVGTWAISYSDIQSGFVGPGNVDQEPLFLRDPDPGFDAVWGTADDDFGDLRLPAVSPLVDTGNNAAVPTGVTTDLAGTSRFIDIYAASDTGIGTPPIADMGAYEAVNALSANAGGPYVVVQGNDITLSGRGASAVPGAVEYAWEWDGDGLFDDAAGPNPLFDTAGIAGGSVIPVSLRVTDDASQSITSTTSLTVLPTTIYVDSRATGAGNGASWTDAYASLAYALTNAISGVSIHVAQGTYKPTALLDRTVTFNLKNGVAILGGYAGVGAANPDQRDVKIFLSILSGDIGVIGTSADNSNCVVSSNACDSTAILDGFTITAAAGTSAAVYVTGGNPTFNHCRIVNNFETGMTNKSASPNIWFCDFISNISSRDGGGMYNLSSSPIVATCTFTNNRVTSASGGAVFNSSSAPTFTDCTFSGNTASSGGAMTNHGSSAVIQRCAFSANSSSQGGAISNFSASTSLLAQCTFIDNSTAGDGGAFYNSLSSPQLTDCLFIRNRASPATGYSGYGGAIYSTDDNPDMNTVYLNRCQFLGNTASAMGGAVYNRKVGSYVNCLFVGNSADVGGSVADAFGKGSIVNCTIVANTANSGGALSYYAGIVYNSIIWGNTGTSTIVSISTARYCDIQGYGSSGNGNRSADPMFVRSPAPGPDTRWGTADDDYGDLRLRIDSPCIDAGDNSAVPAGITTDIAGNPRFIDIPGVHDPGAIVDMGAYERVPPIADAGYLFNAVRPTVSVKFGFDALASSISASDLLLANLTTGQTLDCALISTLSYDPLTRTAAWVFNSALPDGNFRAILPAKSLSDNSGLPALGTNLTLDFFALGGDANRDRIVDINDLAILATNWQGSNKLFSQGDFNYDGKVDAKDLGILSSHWQRTLPPPVPTAPVRAPTRTPVRVATLVL